MNRLPPRSSPHRWALECPVSRRSSAISAPSTAARILPRAGTDQRQIRNSSSHPATVVKVPDLFLGCSTVVSWGSHRNCEAVIVSSYEEHHGDCARRRLPQRQDPSRRAWDLGQRARWRVLAFAVWAGGGVLPARGPAEADPEPDQPLPRRRPP